MKYVIKLTLEQDGEQEKQWAIGCELGDDPTENDIYIARGELLKCAKVQIELLLQLDWFGCSFDISQSDVTL